MRQKFTPNICRVFAAFLAAFLPFLGVQMRQNNGLNSPESFAAFLAAYFAAFNVSNAANIHQLKGCFSCRIFCRVFCRVFAAFDMDILPRFRVYSVRWSFAAYLPRLLAAYLPRLSVFQPLFLGFIICRVFAAFEIHFKTAF